MVRRWKPLGLLLAVLLCAHGCLSVLRSQYTPFRDRYFDVLEKWSRTEKVYHSGETHFFITATYKSDEYLGAYASYYAEVFDLSPGQVEDQKHRILGHAAGYHDFLVTLFTVDPRWNNLADKDSTWRVCLVNEKGEELRTSYVRDIRNPTPEMKLFFPYISSFDTVYEMGFPRMTDSGLPFVTPADKSLTLKLIGGLGRAELKWDI